MKDIDIEKKVSEVREFCEEIAPFLHRSLNAMQANSSDMGQVFISGPIINLIADKILEMGKKISEFEKDIIKEECENLEECPTFYDGCNCKGANKYQVENIILRFKNDELEKKSRAVFCTWCGHSMVASPENLSEVYEKMKEHDAQCDKHPSHAHISQLEKAIVWALGYTDFAQKQEGDPPYWWRQELAERSGMTDEHMQNISQSIEKEKK